MCDILFVTVVVVVVAAAVVIHVSNQKVPISTSMLVNVHTITYTATR
jgi:hypothetical protein